MSILICKYMELFNVLFCNSLSPMWLAKLYKGSLEKDAPEVYCQLYFELLYMQLRVS